MPPRPIPLVKQALDYSCGAACLASVLQYYGVWNGVEAELYPLLNTNIDGTMGEKLLQVAQGYGLIAMSDSELWIDDLRRYVRDGYVAILSIQAEGNGWEEGHYVVLVEVLADRVKVMDPLIGAEREIPIVELLGIWHDYDDQGRHEYQGAILLRQG